MQQYHRFMAGRLGSSTTRSFKSNLLRTWDYFYNSGGWDDYPPQVYIHAKGLESAVTPVITTAQVIRTAKIMRMAALALGEDPAEYDADIAALSHDLQTYAWDEEAGYFSYVLHDTDGHPTEILRHESGANFNMGLDGASPLTAGICTPEQEARLVAALMSPERMWCRYGLRPWTSLRPTIGTTATGTAQCGWRTSGSSGRRYLTWAAPPKRTASPKPRSTCGRPKSPTPTTASSTSSCRPGAAPGGITLADCRPRC
jgi:hypothetical protein